MYRVVFARLFVRRHSHTPVGFADVLTFTKATGSKPGVKYCIDDKNIDVDLVKLMPELIRLFYCRLKLIIFELTLSNHLVNKSL